MIATDTNRDRLIISPILENINVENNGSSFDAEKKYAPDFPSVHKVVVP